jgi:hypothetical protein
MPATRKTHAERAALETDASLYAERDYTRNELARDQGDSGREYLTAKLEALENEIDARNLPCRQVQS